MIVGIDIGGTKTHVRVEKDGTVVLDTAVPTSSWQHGGLLDDDENATRLLALFAGVEGAGSAPLVVGAHGLDSERQAREFHRLLAARRDGWVQAVNDVELLAPAAGFRDAIAVIVGTGSKVVAHTAQGEVVSAGGYGFLLNDPGSAAALAREAVRAVIEACDEGAAPDTLGRTLMAHYGVDDEVALCYEFTADATLASWAAVAPLVFAAADSGSELAVAVVDAAAKELARGVGQVHARGAAGTDVVCAGGVIVNQPRLYRALVRHIGDLGLGLSVQLVDVPPVIGAIALARQSRTPAPSN
ncbi:BadF/BadG/BcrA/BcrD ATPase family protein [soil metagenome]